jgi:hypothetical protein
VTGDRELTVTFAGRTYTAVSVDPFTFDDSVLTEIGPADTSILPQGDGKAWGIRGVNPAEAILIYKSPGSQSLFVERELILAVPNPQQPRSQPLAAAIPELCPYFNEPVPLECPPPSASEAP